jgi:hypothetical protein
MIGDDDNDSELNSYLQAKDGLSAEIRKVSPESPPGHIDAAILAASRKAVGSKPMGAAAPFSNRWHVPIAIAAVVVLSVLVVFNIPDDSIPVRYEPASDIQSGAVLDTLDEDFPDPNTPLEKALLLKKESTEESEADTFTATQQAGRLAPQRPAADAPAVPADERRREPEPISLMREIGSSAGSRANEAENAVPVEAPMQIRQSVQTESRAVAGSIESMAVENTAVDSVAANLEQKQLAVEISQCTLPRPEICTEEYMPVCAVRDTGVRCVTTPCDSTEHIEYSNACAACSDADVISYTDGRCE